jgi:hypothetical protein
LQANYFFVASFIAEALLKIYALGWRVYWKEPWHRWGREGVVATRWSVGVLYRCRLINGSKVFLTEPTAVEDSHHSTCLVLI